MDLNLDEVDLPALWKGWSAYQIAQALAYIDTQLNHFELCAEVVTKLGRKDAKANMDKWKEFCQASVLEGGRAAHKFSKGPQGLAQDIVIDHRPPTCQWYQGYGKPHGRMG